MTTAAIVTPWHEHPELWPDYQNAIEDGQPDELWIVDNGSDPPLEFATFRFDTNQGFSKASNIGLRAAGTDIVVFLNNDIRLARTGWLAALVDRVEPGVLAGRLRTDHHAAVDGTPMPYLDGWCLAGMRDDLLELGGFDEGLEEPAYYSDNLLCLEARAAGMRLREAPVGLTHLSGATSQPGLNPTVGRVTVANQAVYRARARQLVGAA